MRIQVRKAVSFSPPTNEVIDPKICQAHNQSVVPKDLLRYSVNGGLDNQHITPPVLQVTDESDTKPIIRRSRQKSIKLVNEELHIGVPLEVNIRFNKRKKKKHSYFISFHF